MKGKQWFSIFFVILIGYELSFGQEDMYRIQMNLKYKTWSNNKGHSICEANFFLNIFEDGHKRALVQRYDEFHEGISLVETTKGRRIAFSLNAYAKRNVRFGNDCGGAEARLNELPLNVGVCKRFTHPPIERGKATQLQIHISMYVTPLHTLNSEKLKDTLSNTYLPIGTKVKLLAKEGFPSELYHYQVATKVDSTRIYFPPFLDQYIKKYHWQNLRADLKKGSGEILSVSAEDVFGSKAEAERNLGKTVYFRVVSFDKDTPTQVCSSSNVIPLKVTISAPKPEFTFAQPHCPNDQGSATLRFDRDLYSGEEVQLSLVQGKMVDGKFVASFPIVSYDNEQFKANLKNKTITLNNITPLSDSLHWYQLQLSGKYHYGTESITTFSDGEEFDKTFRIVAIPEIKADISSENNKCYGKSEGSIKVSISGGTPPYRYTIDGKTVDVTGSEFTLANLPAGDYTVGILDSRGCQKEGAVTATITQPTAIHIVNENEEEEKNEQLNPLFFKKDVSGFGLKNGEIQVVLTGGTPFEAPSEPYRVTLTTKNGTTISTFSTQTNLQNQFVVHYSQLDKGDYILAITDKNNCILTKNIFIDEPDPLVVSITEKTAISCNPANEDPNNDPKLNKDGELYAYVKGGRPPYQYQWYRIEGTNAERLPSETESVLKQLTEGTYRVDIKDKKNNTTQGTFTLKFPKRLTLTTESTEIRCSDPTSGTAKALPQGGTPPYSYQWSDGQTSQTASGLSVGKYFVSVTDSKGCMVQSQVVLSYPEAARIDSEQVTQLSCYGDSNGSITLSTSGGKGKVVHTWYDASGNILTKGVSKDGKSVKNLSAGRYKIELRDQGDCPPIEKTFEIIQPERLQLNIPNQVTICQDDSYIFDVRGQVANATYRWTDVSGNLLSTEAFLEVRSAGDYYVEAITEAGCKVATKTSVKQSSQVLEVDFLVATTSYYDYTLKLINLSKKVDALQWQFPDDVIVINQNKQEAEVRFPKEGTYTVGLRGTLGECQKVIEKQLFVEKDRVGISQGVQIQKNIESFLIVPNPNSGSYQLHIKLHKASSLRVRLIDMLGRELFTPEEFSANTDFVLSFDKPGLAAGQYIILIEADGDVLSQKMIVK